MPAAPPDDSPPWLVPWQTAGRFLGSVGEVVLVTGSDGTGIQALDASDGELLWGPSVPGADCALVTGPAALCTRSRYSSGGPVATALDLAGGVLGTFVPTGSVLALWSVADDVVVLGRDTGHLLATRWRPATGTTVWQYRSSDPVVAPAGYPFWAEVVGDQIVVGGTRAVVVGLADGREVPAVQRSDGGRRSTVAG